LVVAGKPPCRLTIIATPSAAIFLVIILMIPLFPSASYFAEGAVMISIF